MKERSLEERVLFLEKKFKILDPLLDAIVKNLRSLSGSYESGFDFKCIDRGECYSTWRVNDDYNVTFIMGMVRDESCIPGILSLTQRIYEGTYSYECINKVIGFLGAKGIEIDCATDLQNKAYIGNYPVSEVSMTYPLFLSWWEEACK